MGACQTSKAGCWGLLAAGVVCSRDLIWGWSALWAGEGGQQGTLVCGWSRKIYELGFRWRWFQERKSIFMSGKEVPMMRLARKTDKGWGEWLSPGRQLPWERISVNSRWEDGQIISDFMELPFLLTFEMWRVRMRAGHPGDIPPRTRCFLPYVSFVLQVTIIGSLGSKWELNF